MDASHAAGLLHVYTVLGHVVCTGSVVCTAVVCVLLCGVYGCALYLVYTVYTMRSNAW